MPRKENLPHPAGFRTDFTDNPESLHERIVRFLNTQITFCLYMFGMLQKIKINSHLANKSLSTLLLTERWSCEVGEILTTAVVLWVETSYDFFFLFVQRIALKCKMCWS